MGTLQEKSKLGGYELYLSEILKEYVKNFKNIVLFIDSLSFLNDVIPFVFLIPLWRKNTSKQNLLPHVLILLLFELPFFQPSLVQVQMQIVGIGIL